MVDNGCVICFDIALHPLHTIRTAGLQCLPHQNGLGLSTLMVLMVLMVHFGFDGD
jgi:hypothetical protein